MYWTPEDIEASSNEELLDEYTNEYADRAVTLSNGGWGTKEEYNYTDSLKAEILKRMESK